MWLTMKYERNIFEKKFNSKIQNDIFQNRIDGIINFDIL